MSLALFLGLLVTAGPHYFNMIAHARADSEGGMFAHGMSAMMYALPLLPILLITTVIWTLGIYHESRKGREVPKYEPHIAGALLCFVIMAIAVNWFPYASIISTYLA